MYRNLDWWDDAQRAHTAAVKVGVSCRLDCPICGDPMPPGLPDEVRETFAGSPVRGIVNGLLITAVGALVVWWLVLVIRSLT